MNRFIQLHFAESGDPLYVDISRIIAFHQDQDELSGDTLVFMSLGAMEDGSYIVQESPETIAGLIEWGK